MSSDNETQFDGPIKETPFDGPIKETPINQSSNIESLICEHWLKGHCAFGKKCKNVHVCKANLHNSCPRGSCNFAHMEQKVLNQQLAKQRRRMDLRLDVVEQTSNPEESLWDEQRQVTQHVRIPKHVLGIALICVIVFYFL